MLAEHREAAGKELTIIEQLRDSWHEARSAGKPQSELESIKAKIAEHRSLMDGHLAKLDDETQVAELDTYLADIQKRTGKKPGRDDFGPRAKNRRQDGSKLSKREAREAFAGAMQGWCCRELGLEVSKRHRIAMKAVAAAGLQTGRCMRFKTANTMNFRRAQRMFRATHESMLGGAAFEKRAMSALLGSSGGFGVSDGFVAAIDINQLAYSGVLQAAEVMRTARGEDLPWPTSDDTGNEGEIIGASKPIDTGDRSGPTLNRVIFRAYKSHSKVITVPEELLEDWDAAPNLVDFLQQAMSERIGRHRNRVYTLGSGSKEPRGIVVASALGITAASATELIGDEVLRLIHSVDPAYRMGAAFMMHDSVWLEVLLLKDDNGQYIHTIGLQAGARDVIRGYPVFYNQHMDSALAASNKVALFGQLSKYKVREVASTRVKRFDELYAGNDEVGFDTFIRHDGNLLDAGAGVVRHLKMAA